MKARNIIFSFAALVALTSCDPSSKQMPGNPSDADGTSTCSEEASASNLCKHHLGFTMYMAGKDPIFCQYDSLTDGYAKNFTHILVDGKFHECSFKEFQPGEKNQGSLIWNFESYDELTGYVYHLPEKIPTEYKDFMAILFEKDFVESHRIAVVVKNKEKSLSETANAYLSKRFPTLTIDRIITSATVNNGFANFYTIQYKPIADSCLAINVIEKDGKLYVNENWGHGGWNVDDEGEYSAPGIDFFIANDNSHFDLFFEQYAAESTTLGEFILDGENLKREIITSYYNYVEYNSKRKPNTYSLDSNWKELFTPYDGGTSVEIDSPAYYYVADFNGDGAKEVLAKLDNNYAFFTFEDGNLMGVGSTFDKVSGSEFGSFDLYKNGVVTSGGVAARAETAVYLFGKNDQERISYSEILGGPQIEYEKSGTAYNVKETTASTQAEYEAAKSKLGDKIDLKGLKWVRIDRQ